MRLVKNIFLFQQKIFFISYTLAIVLGFIFGGYLKSIGISFLFVSPFVHLFVYEVKNKNEYYYYYNLGLSKIVLWSSTIIIALINLVILFVI